MTDGDRADGVAAELEALRGKIDRVALLLVALLGLRLFDVFGGAELTGLVLAGLFGLVGLFVALVLYGLARSF
jgi:hypothetical protein